MKWIKIEDQLPSVQTYVIGCVSNKYGKNKHCVAEVFFTESQKWLIENHECIVTHWMQLPKPPKE